LIDINFFIALFVWRSFTV